MSLSCSCRNASISSRLKNVILNDFGTRETKFGEAACGMNVNVGMNVNLERIKYMRNERKQDNNSSVKSHSGRINGNNLRNDQ